MNILYIAFSCSPYHGSEDKIGWNIPVESAKVNNVFVITREEQRQYIEHFLDNNKIKNLKFYYIKLPDMLDTFLSRFPYTIRLNLWHKQALKLTREICEEHNVSVIHQITPVEFRSIGDYGKIPNVKFVCGPIAGGQEIPKELTTYLGKHKLTELIRSVINRTFRFVYSVTGKMKQCDVLLFANRETQFFLEKVIPKGAKSNILADVSIAIDDMVLLDNIQYKKNHKCRFAVVGRLAYLKGHAFLLDALARIPKQLEYECSIVGQGEYFEEIQSRSNKLGLDSNVSLCGAVSYSEISRVYENADVLVMPSFREATGSVLLEAMSKGIPVVTINKFGGATILDDDTGWLYDGNTKEEYIENLKDALVSCIIQPEEVVRRGRNARLRAEEYTWEKKLKFYQSIYEELVES